ncbi:MAG: ATP-binding protein [Lachnospiraceae bacterium]|nr:ATP-binding protein [Lachnospiraceae bacterium]
MALSNSQYNAVMREYEQQQIKDRHDRDRRLAEVYRRIPQIEQLDRDISTRAAACARRVLGGDPDAHRRLKEDLADLREQKETLLAAAGFPADYLEMRYHCKDCKDTGYIDGRRCHCFERARIQILYAQSNIQDVLKRENFSTFSFAYFDDTQVVPGLGMTELAYMKLVFRRCQEFAKSFPEKGANILFTGTTGVGKTFLTNCIAKELIDRYVSVIYLSSHDLFEIFSRYKFSREAGEDVEETYRHILDCELLIIDDLGTEVNNTFVSSQLFYCVNERINRKKGTIISTNLTMDMLRDTYSDRVTSRIMSHYVTIPLYGGDIRMKKKQTSRD